MAVKERTTLSIKLKKGAGVYPKEKTSQSMDHLPPEALIREVELKEYGIVERDGKQYHFQVLRLLIEEC